MPKLPMILTSLLAILNFATLANATFAGERTVNIIAQAYEPLQMMRNGEPTGYVVDLVNEMVRRIKSKSFIQIESFKIVPWRRAYHTASTKPNTIMFSLSRTEKREALFTWIGEIAPYDVHFFKLRERTDVTGTTLNEIKAAGHRIGVPAKGNTNELVKSLGFQEGSDFVAYSHYSKGLRMLYRGRFTVMPLSSFNAHALACREGLNAENLVPVLKVEKLSKPLWMIASKATPSEIVELFRNELLAIKSEGLDVKLRKRYLANFTKEACSGMTQN